MKQDKTEIQISIPKEVKEILQELADADGSTLSDYIEKLISEQVQRGEG